MHDVDGSIDRTTNGSRWWMGALAPGRAWPRHASLIACSLLLLLSLGLAQPTAAAAQSVLQAVDPEAAKGEASSDALSPASISAHLAEIRQEIAAEPPGKDRSDRGTATDPDSVADSLDALEVLLVAQLDLAQRLAASVALSVEPVDPVEPSIFALNQLYEARDQRRKSVDGARRRLAEARASLEAGRAAAEVAEQARRQARVEVEGAAAGTLEEDARRALRVAELASRVAAEDVNLRILDVRVRKAELATSKDDANEGAQIETMRTALATARGSSEDGYRELLATEAALRRQRESQERRLATVELRLKSVGAQYARDPIAGEDLLAVADSLSARRDTIRHEIALIDARIDRLNARTAIWRDWQAAVVSAPPSEARLAEAKRLRQRLDVLSQAVQRLQVQIEAQDRILTTLEDQLVRLDANTSLRASVVDHRDDLTRLQADERASLDEISADIRVTERYVDELVGRSRTIDFRELASRVQGKLQAIWEYEITAVDDSPISVGSLLLALLLMGAGLWVSRRTAAFVGSVAEQRFKLDVGAATSIETLLFYILLVSFGLFALRAIHFPLTAFTVLGGALAIGVGFGSQNVMNNFISGLILMLERPVRAHDTVEVDGSHGTIERIGARSTQIRSTDGRHIIVPNSFFLETNVVNWTLSDDLIRTSVRVGVMYGSPTRLVEELIQRVVDGIEEIHPHPAPIILFDEFGDNSLNFEVHFWLSARGPMQKRRVESRVRFGIDDLFRENSLVIAFPQRDVHLDTLKPLEVRMVDRNDNHTLASD